MLRPVRGEAWTPSVLFGQEDRYKTPLLFEARREPGVSLAGLLVAQRAFLLPFVALDKRKSHISDSGAKHHERPKIQKQETKHSLTSVIRFTVTPAGRIDNFSKF